MIVEFNKARFTFLTNSCFRFEYLYKDSEFLPPCFMAKHTPDKNIKVKHRVEKSTLFIETPDLKIRFSHNGRFKFTLKFKDGENWRFPFKTMDHPFMGLWTTSLDQWYQRVRTWLFPPRRLEPGILRKEGFFYIPVGTYIYPESGWYTERFHLDWYFSGYGSNFEKAFRDACAIFGRPPLVPVWVYALWFSRWYPYTDEELFELIEQFKKFGTPVDVLMVDTDWRGNWIGYEWDKKYFPEPEKFLKEMNSIGVKIGLNDHPGYNHESMDRVLVNWENRQAVEEFVEMLRQNFIKKGVRFWWVDGWGGFKDWRSDSQLWVNHWYYEASRVGGRRGLILSRHGGWGGHRYPVAFSGDVPSCWDALSFEVSFTPLSSSGLIYHWSHDTGGFFGRKIPGELYIRWVQFSAMTPVLRLHSDHGEREPWKFDTEVQKAFKRVYRWRISLIPYFYTAGWEAHRFCLPIVRPLFMLWPDYHQVLDEFLIGQALLAAPVYSRGGRRKIVFPPGRWYYWWGGRVFEEGENTEEFDILEFPVFVREGFAIPVFPEPERVVPFKEGEFPFYTIGILMAGKEAVFSLYIDDGFSENYLKGDYSFSKYRIKVDEEIKIERIYHEGKEYPVEFKVALWSPERGFENPRWMPLKR